MALVQFVGIREYHSQANILALENASSYCLILLIAPRTTVDRTILLLSQLYFCLDILMIICTSNDIIDFRHSSFKKLNWTKSPDTLFTLSTREPGHETKSCYNLVTTTV